METETLDKLFLELSQVTKAKTAREIALEDRLRKIADAMEKIVVTDGEDAGVVLLSTDAPIGGHTATGIPVYALDYFSPLGEALMSVYQISQHNH